MKRRMSQSEASDSRVKSTRTWNLLSSFREMDSSISMLILSPKRLSKASPYSLYSDEFGSTVLFSFFLVTSSSVLFVCCTFLEVCLCIYIKSSTLPLNRFIN